MAAKKNTRPNCCQCLAHARGLIESVLGHIMGNNCVGNTGRRSSSITQYFNSILSHKSLGLLFLQVLYTQKS